MKSKCNLCHKVKELQRVCHVIPEFFYRDSNLYQEYHNLVALDLKLFLKTGERKIVSNKQKKGEFDKYKLCPNCDGKVINEYETYTREFFYADSLQKDKRLKINDFNGYIECVNADYRKLKLLFLSILWRAAISDRPIFNDIVLPEDKQEELRLMILSGSPKSDVDFPIFILNTFWDKKITRDFLFQPISMTFGQEDAFLFMFGGMIINIPFGIKGIPSHLLKYRIQENGVFRSMKVPPGETWNLIFDWYKK